jgi:uncharacterized membrane-anchored protein
MDICSLVSKLEQSVGVLQEPLENMAPKTIAHTNAKMVKNAVANNPTQFINSLSPRMNFVEQKFHLKWSMLLDTILLVILMLRVILQTHLEMEPISSGLILMMSLLP